MEFKKHSLYKVMDVENVIAEVFTTYIKNFWKIFIISFTAIFFYQLLVYHLGFYKIVNATDPDEMVSIMMGLRKEILIATLSYVIIYGFLFTIIINFVLKKDSSQSVHMGELITESLSKYAVHVVFFLILSFLIYIVGAVIGILALFIGFFVALFYLGTVLTIGGTVVVAEEKNALEAIVRSFQLSHKDFWPALGSFVIFALIMVLISFIMSALMSIPLVIIFIDNFKESGSFWDAINLKNYDIGVWSVVMKSIAGAIMYPLYPILSLVLYFKLKFTEDKKANSPVL